MSHVGRLAPKHWSPLAMVSLNVSLMALNALKSTHLKFRNVLSSLHMTYQASLIIDVV